MALHPRPSEQDSVAKHTPKQDKCALLGWFSPGFCMMDCRHSGS